MSFGVNNTTTVTLTCGNQKKTYNFDFKDAQGLTLSNHLAGTNKKEQGYIFGLETGKKEEFNIEDKSLFNKIINFLNYLEKRDNKAGISDEDITNLNCEEETFDYPVSGNGGTFYKPNKDGYDLSVSERNCVVDNNANEKDTKGFLRFELDY